MPLTAVEVGPRSGKRRRRLSDCSESAPFPTCGSNRVVTKKDVWIKKPLTVRRRHHTELSRMRQPLTRVKVFCCSILNEDENLGCRYSDWVHYALYEKTCQDPKIRRKMNDPAACWRTGSRCDDDDQSDCPSGASRRSFGR